MSHNKPVRMQSVNSGRMLKDLAKHQGLKVGPQLALPPEAVQAQLIKERMDEEARREMMQLIHFRATCAMSNLNALLSAYRSGAAAALAEDQEHNVRFAVSYAEQLMVALKMIPNADFFRELEAMATEEANKPTEAPVSSGEEETQADNPKESGIILP